MRIGKNKHKFDGVTGKPRLCTVSEIMINCKNNVIKLTTVATHAKYALRVVEAFACCYYNAYTAVRERFAERSRLASRINGTAEKIHPRYVRTAAAEARTYGGYFEVDPYPLQTRP